MDGLDYECGKSNNKKQHNGADNPGTSDCSAVCNKSSICKVYRYRSVGNKFNLRFYTQYAFADGAGISDSDSI